MKPRLLSAAIMAAVVILDRLTKLYIQTAFGPYDTIPVIPNVFNIVHVENPGAAFGFLSDAPSEWRSLVLLLASGVITVIVAVMLFRPGPIKETALTRFGLAIVLGGALGNLWDRLFRGTVTDFLQVFIGPYEYPSFNIADSAVCIGAGCLILDLWLTRHRGTAQQR
jgi:signal peptidase II